VKPTNKRVRRFAPRPAGRLASSSWSAGLVAALLVGALAGGASAQTTGFSGAGFGDATTTRSTATANSAATATGSMASSPTFASGGADASALLGLVEPPGGREVVTLAELLAALDDAPDTQMARERVGQSEAQRRRAWALLLPTATLSGAYTHTCTGGSGGVDCADRVANVADPKALEQQALLFGSLADIFGAAADAAADPDEAARFRAQQQELGAAADDLRSRAGEIQPVVVQPASQASGQLTLALPLFNPRAWPALWNADDGVTVATLAVRQARQALALVVVRGYTAAFTAQRLVQASERQVALAGEQRAAVAARVAVATQPPLALKRAELELLRARQTLTQARAAADNAVAALGIALGRTTMFALAPPPGSDAADALDPADPSLVERALLQRLEVQMQRAALAIVERGTVDAWMQFLPSVGVSATARATTFTQGFVRDPVTGVLSVTASLPLYDGGLRYAALDDAAARTGEERVRLRQLEERVAAQVRGNQRDVVVRGEAARLANEAFAIATEAHAQARALFDAGVGTALDVSDTAVALFAAETEAVRAEAELAVARQSLRWAVGEPLGPTAR
jgi:outer membrane protein TolC